MTEPSPATARGPLPPVDVVIPAYNAAATVGEALRSVLAQSAPDLRVLVIDDGSTDGTAAIVRDIAAQDARVTCVSRPNGGIVAALNAGLALARAPFVARLDADDLSAPDRHALQLAHFAAHPDCVAVSGAHREIDAEGRPTGRFGRPGPTGGADPSSAPAREPQLTQPFFMARRAALEAVGGYRPLTVSEDSDLYWRLAALGRLDNLEAVLGSYRMHAASISSASVANGRLMAVSSQLAALSARRRGAGRPDVVFDAAASAAWRRESELAGLVARVVADLGLDPAEADWLRVAAAGKLMELAGYRPYEIEPQDCAFIAEALGRAPDLPPGNRAELEKMRAATAARLLRQGRARDARRLAPPRLWPQVLLRAGSNRLYWTKHLG